MTFSLKGDGTLSDQVWGKRLSFVLFQSLRFSRTLSLSSPLLYKQKNEKEISPLSCPKPIYQKNTSFPLLSFVQSKATPEAFFSSKKNECQPLTKTQTLSSPYRLSAETEPPPELMLRHMHKHARTHTHSHAEGSNPRLTMQEILFNHLTS